MSENRRWRRQIERKSRRGQGGFLKSVSPISVPARLWLEMTPATQPPLSRPVPSPALSGYCASYLAVGGVIGARGRGCLEMDSNGFRPGQQGLPPVEKQISQPWCRFGKRRLVRVEVTHERSRLLWEINEKETSEIDLWWRLSLHVKLHCGWTRKIDRY